MDEKERYEYIMNNLRDKARIVEEKGYILLALFLQGSQNYELDIYEDDYKSDIDCKAIIIPTFKDIVLGKAPISTTLVLDNNEHIELKDIRVMKEMWIKQNISYIELLYTKFIVYGEYGKEFIDELLSMRDDISTINKNQFLRCIRGMSMEKLKALEHPYPTIKDKIDKYGYDPKQLHHIIRLFQFIVRYLEDGESLEECYVFDDKAYLLDIKKGVEPLERARVLANTHNRLTNEICKKYETEEDIVNIKGIEELDDWVYRVLEFYLRKELIKR